MPTPSTPELELAAKKIVWNAKKEGNLKDFTPRLVRTTLEQQFNLDEGTLEASEYKSVLKAATKAALKEEPPAEEGQKSSQVEKHSSPASKKKRELDGTVKGEKPTNASSSKGKAKMDKKEDEEEGSAKKRRKTVPKKKKVISDDEGNTSSSPPKRRQAKKEQSFKSAEHVPTSDMEQDEPDPQPIVRDEKSTESSSKTVSNGPLSPKKETTPKKSKDKESVPSNGNLPLDDSGAKSESELSVLIDEPPKQRRRPKTKSEGKEPKKTRVKKEAPILSKDEEKIKRLKSFVVGCGVRKVWSKVFEGLDTPKQQIEKLEEILAELGMHGRMSMEQAKAIKMKRELAQELEDVQAFAKSVESKNSGGRSRRAGKALSSSSEAEKDDSNEDDEEEESDAAPKRPTNARRSIAAFLGDQSDDE